MGSGIVDIVGTVLTEAVTLVIAAISKVVVQYAGGMSIGRIQGSTVIRTSLLPAYVRRGWERFEKALLRSRRIEDAWAPRLSLVHDGRVSEFLDECFFSSN